VNCEHFGVLPWVSKLPILPISDINSFVAHVGYVSHVGVLPGLSKPPWLPATDVYLPDGQVIFVAPSASDVGVLASF